jgi:cysteine desulfurase family protein (TIGR01976 family)
MPLDIEYVRSRFPSLSADKIFFDSPGGSQIAQPALDRMREYFLQMNANRGGAFPTSQRSDRLLDRARATVARFLNAGRAEEIVFGPNMTSLALALSRSLAAKLKPDDELIVTRLDHDANISPWIHAAQATGCRLHWVDFDVEQCTLDVEGYLNLLSGKTRLVALGYASNAVGTINPLHSMIEAAHQVGALTFVDAVQYAPHRAIDVQALDCDFLAFSGYKVFGPHLGVLFGKHELLDDLHPYKVRPAPDRPPGKFETGTQNHEGIAAMLGALEHLSDLGRRFGDPPGDGPASDAAPGRESMCRGMEVIEEYEHKLSLEFLQVANSLSGVRPYGLFDPLHLKDRVPTFALRADPFPPRRIAELLGRRGIYVWDGNFYALAVTERLGLEGSGGLLRIGFVHYNTVGGIHQLGNELESILKRDAPTA